MDLITAKIIALSLLGGLSLILGFLPLKLGHLIDVSTDFEGGRNFWKRTVTSVLLCFGGGVLLATSFVHMLPEVRESIERTSFHIEGVPVAEIFFCCGFFLIYLIEELVHCACDAKVDHLDEGTLHVHKTFTVHSRACEAGSSDLEAFGSQESSPPNSCSTSPLLKRHRTLSTPPGHSQSFSTKYNTFNSEPSSSHQIYYKDHSMDSHGDVFNRDCSSNAFTLEQVHQLLNTSMSSVQSNDFNATWASWTLNRNEVPISHHHNPHHQHQHGHHLNRHSSLRDFLTVLALSCHAIFEGLAIGLENNTDSVWTLFAAVATHKYVISFCVGLELVTARTPTRLYSVYIAVLALVSPLGIVLGILISFGAGSGGDLYTISVAVLQALAGGTLIYVVVFEVLQREKSKSVSGLAQLAFVILGFTVLMCIEIFGGHKHNHFGGHDDSRHASIDP